MDNQELYNSDINKRFNELMQYFINIFWKTLIASIGLVGAITGLIISFSSLSFNHYGLSGLIMIFLITIIITIIVSIIFLFKKIKETPPIVMLDVNKSKEEELLLSSELIETIKKLHKKGKHAEVVRLASNISRPLWISGRYDERISIGAFYEDSAARIKDIKNQIASLVDDLGWTNAVIGNISDAKKYINKGIKISKNNDEYYFAAKGLRHLGTIELRYQDDPDYAIKLLEESLSIASNIKDEKEKLEMIAGIKYNLSECYLLKSENSDAINYAFEVREIFDKLDDKVRGLKVNSQIARILLKDGKIDESKELFSNTLESAKKLSRPDEIGNCLIGLGEIYIIEGKEELAVSILKEAIEVLTEIKSIKELNKANELLLKVNFKKQ